MIMFNFQGVSDLSKEPFFEKNKVIKNGRGDQIL